MDWNQGYTAAFRAMRVDPRTWEPCGVLDGVDKVEIDRDATDDAPLLETCSMTVTRAALDAFEPGWHRVVMEASQGRTGASVPVATLWLDAGKSKYDKGYREDALEGRSALWQAADATVGDGEYAPKGADGPALAGQLLEACIDAPVHVEGSVQLVDHIVYDLDASVLAAAWAILNACGCCIQLDGRGEVHVRTLPTEPALSVDRNGAAGIMPQVDVDGGKICYSREFAPDVYPFSVVHGAIAERGMPEGLYRITSQKLTCDRGIIVEETVEAV